MKKYPNTGCNWDQAQDDELLALLGYDKSLDYIAEAMGRTPGAILARMEFIAVNVKKFRDLKAYLIGDCK